MKRLISYSLILVISISVMLFSVSASSENGNELLNINDYAKYTSSTDNTKVYADLTFPADWMRTHVFWNHVGDTYGTPDLMETGNDINIHNDSTDYQFSLIMFPFSKYINVGDRVGRVITGSKVMDLRYLPSGSSFTYGFDVKITNPLTNVEDFTGTLTEHILYLDENGKVLVHERNTISDPPNFYVGGTRVIQWGDVLDISPVEGAVGFIPFFCLKNIACDLDSDITVNYKGLQVNFSLSNFDYNNMQNSLLKETIDNVQDSVAGVKQDIVEVQNKVDSAINDKVESQAPNNSNDFNDLKEVEDNLTGNIQNYLNEGIGFFDNAVRSVMGLANGFQAIKLLCTPVFNLPFANDIILISVSLGLIGSLIGLVSVASKNINKKPDTQKQGKKNKKE